MAGLFDIGSSGIAAYRKALNVTGQNIANLNTDGYRRRDVSLTEISGSQGGITSISDQAGLGVRAEAINRAFDSYVAGRARDTQSDYFEVEALNTSLLALQDVVIPTDYDVGYFLNEFFSALGAIGQSPGDMAPRLAALEQADSLATGISATANTLEDLRNAILGQAQAVTAELNSNIKALHTMQSQLLSSGQGGSAPNEMLDERERLVLSIGDLAGISVDYGGRGDVTLTLGDTLGGPKLIEGLKSSQVSIKAASGRINVLAGSALNQLPTNQLSSGRLSGLIAAYESVSVSIANLDALAQQVVNDLNTVHSNGLTIDGQRGKDIYSLSNAYVMEQPNNLGEISTTLDFSKLNAPIDLQLVFNAKSNQWQGYDASGNLKVAGEKNITIAGLSLSIEGRPADGDQLLLKSTQGYAANMRFLLTRPEDFAAAGLTIASSSAKNLGNAEVQATVMASPSSTNVPPIDKLLVNGASTLTSTRFLSDGIVASIPENVSAVELFSLSTQNTLSFTVTDDQLDGASNLTVQLSGGEEVFSLSLFTTLLGDDVTADMGDVARLLNSGAITSSGTSTGFTLKDLGLYASGDAGYLTISSSYPEGSTSDYALDDTENSLFNSSAGNATAIFKSGNSEASGIQIFTREGRQIAGSPLSQADVIKYLTPENGFFDGAEYRADYINGVSGIGYLGLGVERSSAQGDFSLTLNGAGFDAVVLGADDDDEDLALPNNTVQSSLIIQMGDDSTETIDIPEGVQAGYIAKLINAQTADIGITATAYSKVALTDIPDGEVSFELSGDGITYQSVTAVVESGALTGLRDAINRHKLVTGVTASLSNDGDRLILVQKNGNDIVLGSIRSGGGEFNAELIDEQSIALSDTTVALGDSQLAARFIGQVTLKSSVEFIVSGLNEAESTSEQDAFLNGFISRKVDTTGSVQNLKFGIYEGIDTNESNPNGTSASSAAGEYSLQIGGDTGLDASVSSSELTNSNPASLAAKLAEKIRINSPIGIVTGDAVETLPEKGASITVSLGGQAYTIEVTEKYVTYDTDGNVATQSVDLNVFGPEAGRLIAKFNESNELQITAQGGIETGQNIVLTSETTDATAFGLGETIVSMMTGRVFDPDDIEGDGVDFSNDVLINVSGTEYSVTVAGTYSSGWSYNVSLPDDIPLGIAISIDETDDGPRLVVEQTHTVTDTSGQNSNLRIEHSTSATQMGLAMVGSQILVADQGMVLTSVDGEAVQSSCTASSIAGERISLTNLPGEELIVIMTGGSGARRLTANFDVLTSPPDLPPRALELKVIDESSGRVEVFDTISGQSIATRFLGDGSQFSAAGYQFVMNGAVQTNDLFYVTASGAAAGDGRNLEAMMQLQSRNEQSGMGGFNDIFRSMITELGAKVHASEIAKASASALRDSAAEIDAEFSGVDLDTEAARLLEQQQAYQALARVLTTARELLNTLLDSI